MRKIVVLAAALSAAVVSNAAPTKCAELQVPGYTLDATLPDFPLLVRISESRISGFAYADCQTGGTDVSFRLPDGTLLDHEVDTWNPDGESLVWVRIPALAKGTTFMLTTATPRRRNTARARTTVRCGVRRATWACGI